MFGYIDSPLNNIEVGGKLDVRHKQCLVTAAAFTAVYIVGSIYTRSNGGRMKAIYYIFFFYQSI